MTDEPIPYDDDRVITLLDKDGTESTWALLGNFDVDEQAYVLLAPLAQVEDEEGDVLDISLFRYASDGEGGETFTDIEDPAERDRVQAIASQLLSEDGMQPA